MKVLLLGSYSHKLTKILDDYDDLYIQTENKINEEYIIQNNIDFVVSFGYQYIITPETINAVKGKIFNIHISYLPWNKGADPNLWSFIENTPKGVTLHYIDYSLDTGDIVEQCQIDFDYEQDTLETSYNLLIELGVLLFNKNWSLMRDKKNNRIKQAKGGSFHYSKDKKRIFFLLNEEPWNTSIKKLIDYNCEN